MARLAFCNNSYSAMYSLQLSAVMQAACLLQQAALLKDSYTRLPRLRDVGSTWAGSTLGQATLKAPYQWANTVRGLCGYLQYLTTETRIIERDCAQTGSTLGSGAR